MNAIIIGGGIGGLTTAIALEIVGVEAHVFERAPSIREVGAGISLWANALDALAAIGLADEIRAHGFKSIRPEVRTPNGRVIRKPPPTAEEFKSPVVGVMHRADLLAMLESWIDRRRIHLGHECIALSDDGQRVTAEFKNGTLERADLLIGADGIHSVVRSQRFSPAPPVYAGYTAWRAVVNFSHSELIPCEIWGRGRRFGVMPLNGERVYWYATHNVPETDPWSCAEVKQTLKTLFCGWFNCTEALIDAADESAILRNNIYDRDPLERWTTGHTTLLGDAAHPMTPNLGQGACQAIEDAVVLAASLKTATDLGEGLLRYEWRRISRANHVVRMSRRIGQVAQWESPLLCSIRDILLPLLPESVSERQIAEIVHYQFLTEEERALFSVP